MGRSRGGLTRNNRSVVDTNGLPVHLALTPGEAHDNRLCSVLLSVRHLRRRCTGTRNRSRCVAERFSGVGS